MFNITLICVGTLKESYWREAYSEYAKRLKLYAKIELIELPEVPFNSVNEKEAVQKKEGELILKKIPSDSTVFVLSEEGKGLSSVEFAQLLSKHSSGEAGSTHSTFVIGGALGLSDAVKKRATKLISFSALTFTHQMIRVILMEQLYRAGTIIAGKQYHY